MLSLCSYIEKNGCYYIGISFSRNILKKAVLFSTFYILFYLTTEKVFTYMIMAINFISINSYPILFSSTFTGRKYWICEKSDFYVFEDFKYFLTKSMCS